MQKAKNTTLHEQEEKYEMAIIESAIDEKEYEKENYLHPRVNAIVLYTGKQKWNVAKAFEEIQEKTDEFLKQINVGGDEDMMAVFETIQQDNKRIYRRGKKDGIMEGIMQNSIEIAKKLLSRNNSKEEVAEITGLKIEEIEKLK